jgi:hypothetical protein
MYFRPRPSQRRGMARHGAGFNKNAAYLAATEKRPMTHMPQKRKASSSCPAKRTVKKVKYVNV